MTHFCHEQHERSLHPRHLGRGPQQRVLQCTTYGRLPSDHVYRRWCVPDRMQPIPHVGVTGSMVDEFRELSEVLDFPRSIG